MPISRLSVTSCVGLEPRPLPSTGVTRLRRYYGPLRNPRRPSLSLAGVWLRGSTPRRSGFPCCVDLRVPTCRRHYPGGPLGSDRSWDGLFQPFPFIPSDGGLPHPSARSAPHWTFRGLLDVHACYPGAPGSVRRAAKRPVCLEGSDGFVASTAAPIATGWSDPVAGWELHPLKINTFPRRTLATSPFGSRAVSRTDRMARSSQPTGTVLRPIWHRPTAALRQLDTLRGKSPRFR